MGIRTGAIKILGRTLFRSVFVACNSWRIHQYIEQRSVSISTHPLIGDSLSCRHHITNRTGHTCKIKQWQFKQYIGNSATLDENRILTSNYSTVQCEPAGTCIIIWVTTAKGPVLRVPCGAPIARSHHLGLKKSIGQYVSIHRFHLHSGSNRAANDTGM